MHFAPKVFQAPELPTDQALADDTAVPPLDPQKEDDIGVPGVVVACDADHVRGDQHVRLGGRDDRHAQPGELRLERGVERGLGGL